MSSGYNLPAGWEISTLGECAEFNPKHPADIPRDTAVSFVPMPSVSEDTGKIEHPQTRTLSEVWKGYTHFQDGDVIFAKITPCMENGKAAVARDLQNGLACGSTEFHVLRPSGGILPEYIWRFLRQETFRQDAEQAMTGAVGQRRVPVEYLRSTTLGIPPLPEQRRIVAKIDSISAKSKRAQDHLDHIPRLVTKYKEAVILAALRGDMTHQWRAEHPSAVWSPKALERLAGMRDEYLRSRRGSRLHSHDQALLESLPPTWAQTQLAEVGTLQVGYAYKSQWYTESGVRLLRGANIAPGQITWDDEKRLSVDRAEEFSSYRLNAGDIVIAMDRPLISTGLKVAVVQPEDEGCLLVQRVARFVSGEFLEQGFAWYVINSRIFLDHAVSRATGSDLPHISSNDILTTPLPLPTRKEQREIVKRISTAFAWIDRLASEATSARKLIDHLDQAILFKAFRGELVPQDPTDEPASVLLERIRAERAGAAANKGRRTRSKKEAA